ncbi:MAG: hypothetical protein V4658_01445 [Bacteroidota bacterium]
MSNKNNSGIYRQMHRFAEVTKTCIINGNIQRAKRCLETAETIFNKGNAEVRNAISNVYVFSVSSFMEIHHCNIRNLFPRALQNEYNRQVNTSGI